MGTDNYSAIEGLCSVVVCWLRCARCRVRPPAGNVGLLAAQIVVASGVVVVASVTARGCGCGLGV